MENPLKIILFLLLLLGFQSAFSQTTKSFCKVVEHTNFKKIERMIKRQIKHDNRGHHFFNGKGSGYQINWSPYFDSITSWFKRQDCVADAFWDKCQEKIALYPGYVTIGVQFKTSKGVIEKCYLIQQGTTGQAKLGKWHPKLFKAKSKLVYIKMNNCAHFIEQQKKNCERIFK